MHALGVFLFLFFSKSANAATCARACTTKLACALVSFSRTWNHTPFEDKSKSWRAIDLQKDVLEKQNNNNNNNAPHAPSTGHSVLTVVDGGDSVIVVVAIAVVVVVVVAVVVGVAVVAVVDDEFIFFFRFDFSQTESNGTDVTK